jgi:hypothetical protein
MGIHLAAAYNFVCLSRLLVEANQITPRDPRLIGTGSSTTNIDEDAIKAAPMHVYQQPPVDQIIRSQLTLIGNQIERDLLKLDFKLLD